MRSPRLVRALRRPALWAALMSTVGCGGNSLVAGDSLEGGTSGTATSGAAGGSSGQTGSAGAAATGSTESGSGASATGESRSASGATSGASSGAGATTCRTTSDCPPAGTPFASSVTCEFALDLGCSAVGTCVTSPDTGPGPACSRLYYGCGCDGTDVYLGCDTSPSLIASKPISRLGRCESDGGIPEASIPADSPPG
jgi:hypothetical protein